MIKFAERTNKSSMEEIFEMIKNRKRIAQTY